MSTAESSIASPFTFKKQNIECVPLLINEGRATLITSFGVVKFICMYSLTQFISVLLLFSENSTLSDMEFLYIDLVLILLISFFFSRNEASEILDKQAPANKLISWRPIVSLIFHTLLLLGFQLIIFKTVQFQPWYSSMDEKFSYKGLENSALFYFTIYQYLTQAIIFSKGFPYRKSIFSNKLFLLIFIFALVLNIFITFTSFEILNNFFIIVLLPNFDFKLFIIETALINFFVSFLFETFLFNEEFYIYSLKKKSSI